MRAWNTTDNCITVKAHEPAVWCVSGLHRFDGTDRVLTGICMHEYTPVISLC